VDDGLPRASIDAALARVTRHNANTLAYAEALQYTESEADAALDRGDDKKALEFLDRALYLATMGQAEEQEADRNWVAAVKNLAEQSWYFNDELRTSGATAEEALERWLEEVRNAGLPADYVNDLREAGWTDEQIAQHRDGLLAITPAQAASLDRQFGVVASVNKGEGRTVEDWEWELATIRLLQLREQLALSEPGDEASAPETQ